MPLRSGRVEMLQVAAVLALALVLRLGLLERQGLWADEVFSLAIATGHSLEHAAAEADAPLGDFVEAPSPLDPGEYVRYASHERPPAGLGRVLRAVRMSDTSPPLYYVLLYGWTRAVGVGDASVRGFSVFWAMAAFPLLWWLAARVGGRRASLPAVLLFAAAPLSVYYSTEARMYSLLWFWVLATACLTLAVRAGGSAAVLAGWALASAGGFLTHYFFAFVWAAMLSWLLWLPGRTTRPRLLVAAALVGLAVLPWYATVPEALGQWRVTRDWLKMTPPGYSAVGAPFALAVGFASGRGVWGGGVRADWAAAGLYALAGGALVWKLRRRAFVGGRLLAWMWLAAACLGPLVFDAFRGTYTAAVPRYALAGLPSAIVLIAVAVARVPSPLRWSFVALALAAWSPGLWYIHANRSRNGCPLRDVAQQVGAKARPSDVLLVHSIPSGVVGVARYLTTPVPMASWVGQLGVRSVPESVESLTAGRERAFLVLVHTVGEPAPQEAYLRERSEVLSDGRRQTARILEFDLRNPPAPPGRVSGSR